MEANVLKIVGEIAGIGGLALGVLLLLFRQVIAKNVFSSLTREHSYRLLRLILTLVWSIAVLGIAAWFFSSQSNSKPTVEDQTWKRNYSLLASRPFPQVQGFGKIGAPPQDLKRGDFKMDLTADLRALVLTGEPELETKRAAFLNLVERAPAINERNPGIFLVDDAIETAYREFKVLLRAASVKNRVDVERLEREQFIRPQ